ncbi:MAG: HAD family phosphatase [Oscillospiraceae bacterium]|nr:HAD family phosphatase [Oscillospiraceae bacterium]
MQIRGAIFDMDGTLIDSMGMWSTIGSAYISSVGKIPKEDIDRRFSSMGVHEAAVFMKEEYDLEGTCDEITETIYKRVEKSYFETIPLKKGVVEFLEYIESKNIPMCIATATDEYMADAALKRLGIRKFFKGIFTSRAVGEGKDQPKIFFEGARLLGTEPSETAVFEDSVVAIRTASAAGFITAAVPDDSFACARDEIKKLATMWEEDLTGYIGKI